MNHKDKKLGRYREGVVPLGNAKKRRKYEDKYGNWAPKRKKR